MSKNVEEIIVGANGSIFTAPKGTAIPDSINDPLGPGWVDLGYASEDGVTWVDGKSLQSIRAWQSLYDLRRIVESKEGSLAFQLMQWSADTTKLAFGGGEIEDLSDGPESPAYRYTPPPAEEIDERMMAVEWVDGDFDFRLTFPKGIVAENVETNVVRTAAALLPITFALLGEDGTEPFILDTNHPAYAETAGSGS